jgi:hypothetical protein
MVQEHDLHPAILNFRRGYRLLAQTAKVTNKDTDTP